MISRFESNYHATETPDAVVRDRSYPQCVDTPHTDDDNQHSGTWLAASPASQESRLVSFIENLVEMVVLSCVSGVFDDSKLCTEDGELKNDSLSSNNTLLLKKPSSSFDNHDYVEKINEFEFYVDMVKEIARPGCSPEMLNVALSSLSTLVKTLSMISSKQCLHASL